MRFLAALLLWLIATASLAAAVPAAWVQLHLVDEDGYAALAQRASGDPKLQSAVAAELTLYAATLIRVQGHPVDASVVHGVAAGYTAGPTFAPQFAQANRIAHQWMFTPQPGQDRWVIDLAPMLNDPDLRQLLGGYGVQLPATATIPVTAGQSDALRPGRLQPLADWGPWVCRILTIVAGVCALLTVLAARSRGKALAALGVSALIAGLIDWLAMGVGRGWVDDLLGQTAPGIRAILQPLVAQGVAGLREWITVTLVAGAVLVVFGVSVAMLVRPRGD